VKRAAEETIWITAKWKQTAEEIRVEEEGAG
jgi:hypothetical protein